MDSVQIQIPQQLATKNLVTRIHPETKGQEDILTGLCLDDLIADLLAKDQVEDDAKACDPPKKGQVEAFNLLALMGPQAFKLAEALVDLGLQASDYGMTSKPVQAIDPILGENSLDQGPTLDYLQKTSLGEKPVDLSVASDHLQKALVMLAEDQVEKTSIQIQADDLPAKGQVPAMDAKDEATFGEKKPTPSNSQAKLGSNRPTETQEPPRPVDNQPRLGPPVTTSEERGEDQELVGNKPNAPSLKIEDLDLTLPLARSDTDLEVDTKLVKPDRATIPLINQGTDPKVLDGLVGDPSIDQPTNVLETSQTKDIVASLLERVQHLKTDQEEVLRITLKPEELGHLEIRITMKDKEIQGQLLVDSWQGKEWLQRELGALTTQFQQKSMVVSQWEIIDSSKANAFNLGAGSQQETFNQSFGQEKNYGNLRPGLSQTNRIGETMEAEEVGFSTRRGFDLLA